MTTSKNEELLEAIEYLQWMSGSVAFGPGGDAREYFVSNVIPFIKKHSHFLSQRGEQEDIGLRRANVSPQPNGCGEAMKEQVTKITCTLCKTDRFADADSFKKGGISVVLRDSDSGAVLAQDDDLCSACIDSVTKIVHLNTTNHTTTNPETLSAIATPVPSSRSTGGRDD